MDGCKIPSICYNVIRNMPKNLSYEGRFFEKIRKTNNCWIWIGAKYNEDGYGSISLGKTNDGKKKRMLAHRYSYTIHKGEIPKGMLVCHSCDNPSCVNPDHLWLGTIADNNRDSYNKGRYFFQKNRPKKSLN